MFAEFIRYGESCEDSLHSDAAVADFIGAWRFGAQLCGDEYMEWRAASVTLQRTKQVPPLRATAAQKVMASARLENPSTRAR